MFSNQCGCLPLLKNILLENVMFVRSLNCTLLSVVRLLKQTGCFSIFTDILCVLHHRFTRIGAGEKRMVLIFTCM